VPSPRKVTPRKSKDVRKAQAKVDCELIRAASRNGHRSGPSKNGTGRDVKVSVRLLPETRLLVALANEEVMARRKAGQTEAKIWKDCQRAPLNFVKRGFKRLLSA
jgi:hypothetical protein